MENTFRKNAFDYLEHLKGCFTITNLEAVEELALELLQAWVNGRNVFLCGNGGSAANAIHIANDLHYGIGACGSDKKLPGIRVEALSANSSVITCLANDTGRCDGNSGVQSKAEHTSALSNCSEPCWFQNLRSNLERERPAACVANG